MKKNDWQDRIFRELEPEPLEPVSDRFYAEVRRRIKSQSLPNTIEVEHAFLPVFVQSCWKAIPAFVAFMIILFFYGWHYPPDFAHESSGAVESLLWNSDAAPSDSDLFYSITHNLSVSDLEKEP